jgi:hypothetical protein
LHTSSPGVVIPEAGKSIQKFFLPLHTGLFLPGIAPKPPLDPMAPGLAYGLHIYPAEAVSP